MKEKSLSNCKYYIGVMILIAVILVCYVPILAAESNEQSDSVVLNLINELREKSPAIKSEQYRSAFAMQSYEDSLWLRYPTPSANIQRSVDERVGDSSNESVFSLTQPIWSGGRISNSIDYEKSKIDAAEGEVEVRSLSVANEFVDILGDWIVAKQKLDSYVKTTSTYQDLIDTIERRVEVGASPNADKLLIDARIRNLDNDIAREENQLIIVAKSLSNILGRMVSTVDLTNYGFGNPLNLMPKNDPPNLDNLYSLILKHPEIALLNKKIKMHDIEYKKIKSEVWPTLSVEFRYTKEDRLGSSVDDSGVFLNLSSNWDAGLSSFNAHKKIISDKQATISDKEFQIQNLLNLYINELMLYEVTLLQVQNIRQSIESSYQVYDSYKRQYLAGKKTWIELLNAVQEIIRYEVELGELLATMFITRWKLELLRLQDIEL